MSDLVNLYFIFYKKLKLNTKLIKLFNMRKKSKEHEHSEEEEEEEEDSDYEKEN